LQLVVVLVAQGGACGIEDVPDADSGTEVVDVDGGVKSQWVSGLVVTVDSGCAGVGVLVLPDAEVAVDEGVVQEEEGVGR